MDIELQNRTELLDIDTILKNKNPGLYRKIPKFIVSWIKRLVHQNELNDFISRNNKNQAIDFLRNSFDHFNIRSETYYIENFPDHSKVIVVSNHPIGSFDGLHMMNIVYSKYGCVKAVVNDLLLNVKNLNEFFLGVNKHGMTSKQHIEELNTIFESDMPIVYFPAGLVSRKSKGEIKDTEWKKTFISKAIKYERDIVPVFVKGSLTNKFYNIARFRKFIGIKKNIEMLYLPDEMIKQYGKTIRFTIGKPISYKTFEAGKNHEDYAQNVKDHVYKLEKNPEANFQTK
jgi:putative hemolysin